MVLMRWRGSIELRLDWVILLWHIILTPLNASGLLLSIVTPTCPVKWIRFRCISIVAMSQVFFLLTTF